MENLSSKKNRKSKLIKELCTSHSRVDEDKNEFLDFNIDTFSTIFFRQTLYCHFKELEGTNQI